MDAINFNNIINLNCSLKESTEESEKVFLYSDDNDKAQPKYPIKVQFSDVFKTMLKNLNTLTLNAPNIIKEKKFSCKKLFNNYSNITAYKINENLNKKKFASIKNNFQFNKNSDNNNNSKILNLSNSNSLNNIFSYMDIYSMSSLNNSKNSNNSEKIRNLTENKRKRQNSHNGVKEDSKKIYNDIINICKTISSIDSNLIEIKERQNELLIDNSYDETTLICKNKEIATIYINENSVQRVHIIKGNKIFTEEIDISNNLKNIKKYFNRILNKLKKSK